MPIQSFHPAVADWFNSSFRAPTEVQRRAWPLILQRRHTLLAAPTGSGKTLAAFLTAIDELVREGLESGLTEETRVLYVSPLPSGADAVALAPGTRTTVAFAVWNGSAGDRDGKKSVTIWQELVLEN